MLTRKPSLLALSLGLAIPATWAADLHPQVAPQLLEIDRARSNIYVVTHRSGLLSFFGHDHAILATDWSAHVCWTSGYTLVGQGRIDVATSALVIDGDSARTLAGLKGGPSPEQVRKLQEKMLSARHLDATNHPRISLTVGHVSLSQNDRLEVQGELNIRGHAREVRFPVAILNTPEGGRMRGVLTVPQSGFGIRPESVAGVVRVADRVDIHFDLAWRPATEGCAEGSRMSQRSGRTQLPRVATRIKLSA